MKRLAAAMLLLVGVGAVVAGIVLASRPVPTVFTNSDFGEIPQCTVIDVIDGDTLRVKIQGHVSRVRLLGVDAPEWNRKTDDSRVAAKPNAPMPDPEAKTENPKPAQPFGADGAAYLTELVLGETVRLQRDIEPVDKYGRILAYVYRVRDDVFVNQELIRRGSARFNSRHPLKHRTDFYAAERDARREQLGIWSESAKP